MARAVGTCFCCFPRLKSYLGKWVVTDLVASTFIGLWTGFVGYFLGGLIGAMNSSGAKIGFIIGFLLGFCLNFFKPETKPYFLN